MTSVTVYPVALMTADGITRVIANIYHSREVQLITTSYNSEPIWTMQGV